MSPETGNALAHAWLGYAFIATVFVVGAMVWAFRSGQFSREDRIRHLPLHARIPEEEPGERHAGQGSAGGHSTENGQCKEDGHVPI